MTDSARPVHPVTARIRELFEPFRGADGRVKVREAARGINKWAAETFPDDEVQRKQHQLSPTYLTQLLSGARTNPTAARLRSIATYVGVPVQEVLPGDDDLTEFRRLLADFRAYQAQQDPDVLHIMARVRTMDPTQLKTAGSLLDALMQWTRPPEDSDDGDLDDGSDELGEDLDEDLDEEPDGPDLDDEVPGAGPQAGTGQDRS